MLEAEILMKQRHADEVVILKKLIEEEKYERDCKVTSLREQIRELKDNLEYKETFMQTKEKKWSDVEKIFVEYAKEDEDLQNKLDELNYIWDICSTARKIGSVVEENMDLKEKINELQSQLSEVMTHQSSGSPNDDLHLEAYYGMGKYIRPIINSSKNIATILVTPNDRNQDGTWENQISMSLRHNLMAYPKMVKHKTQFAANHKVIQTAKNPFKGDPQKIEKVLNQSVSNDELEEGEEDEESDKNNGSIDLTNSSVELEEPPEIVFNADDWRKSDIEGFFSDKNNPQFNKQISWIKETSPHKTSYRATDNSLDFAYFTEE